MSSYSSKTTSSSVAVDENKKKTTLLKDNSWIKRQSNEEELVDDDPNFGKSVLHQYKSSETLVSPSDPEPVKSTKPASSSTSVHTLTKRFGINPDELYTSPSSKTSTSYTRRYTSGKTDTPSMVMTTEEPKTSTKTTTVTKNGSTTETTIITSQSIKSAVIKSPTKTETFSERVKSSSKGSQYSAYSPTKTTTTMTEKTVTSTKDAADDVFDSLQAPLRDEDLTAIDGKTAVSTTETVTVKDNSDIDAENKLYDTLIPISIKDKSLDSTFVTTTRTVTVKSSPDSYTDDKYNTLITKPVRDDTTDSKSAVTSSKSVTVKSSSIGDNKTTTTTTTKTSYDPEDEPYDSFLPKTILSGVSSSKTTTKREVVTVSSSKGSETSILTTPTSTRTISYSSYTDDITPPRTSSYSDTYNKNYSYKDSYSSRPDVSYEYTSISSPSLYSSSSYKSSSWTDGTLTDPVYTKSSTKSVYQSSPDRPVLEKDLCTSCRKPFTGDAKMILDDMKINCHATCFKCDVCNITLGNMKAGDSLWIYKRMVHCENCFEATREKWRR